MHKYSPTSFFNTELVLCGFLHCPTKISTRKHPNKQPRQLCGGHRRASALQELLRKPSDKHRSKRLRRAPYRKPPINTAAKSQGRSDTLALRRKHKAACLNSDVSLNSKKSPVLCKLLLSLIGII